MSKNHPPYAVITPARNAARHIEHVLTSMNRQTIPPLCWVVVNDGSTDETGEILSHWKAKCPFLDIVEIPTGAQRDFASKVKAFNNGYERIVSLEYEFVGNIDADMTLPADYFERLLAEFQHDPKLGIASGVYLDEQADGRFRDIPIPTDYSPGALQLFRRKCFDEIGGYPSLRVGGIDTAAVWLAKMKGWKVRSFPALKAIHHGRSEMTFYQTLQTRHREGVRDYGLGMHPAYGVAKFATRLLKEKPLILGATTRFAGYIHAWLLRYERQLPPDLIAFVRQEEFQRLRSIWRKT